MLRLHAFLALILGALVVAALTPGATTPVGVRVAEGFANTARDIAILIAMASIVGETLLASGAAERIVVSSRRVLGDNRAGLAFLISGYVLGIPVFFDTVFYLLIPLGKVMRVADRAGLPAVRAVHRRRRDDDALARPADAGAAGRRVDARRRAVDHDPRRHGRQRVRGDGGVRVRDLGQPQVDDPAPRDGRA